MTNVSYNLVELQSRPQKYTLHNIFQGQIQDFKKVSQNF